MTVRWICLVVALMAVAAPRAAADGPPRGLDDLRAQIAAVLAREQVPGAGIALVEGDRILWTGGVGLADRATARARSPAAPAPTTRFRSQHGLQCAHGVGHEWPVRRRVPRCNVLHDGTVRSDLPAMTARSIA